MSSSQSNKLHPIYVALDSYQYSRAVKLASALPPSNVLGQALLAVALQKSGQEYKALKVIAGLLPGNEELWFELRERLKHTCPQEVASTPAPPVTTKSKGKKNKKRTTTTSAKPAAKEQPVKQPIDWIQELEVPPAIPENWDKVSENNQNKALILDETVLSTLTIPLQASRMYVTLYQMYVWACQAATNAKSPPHELIPLVSKNFLVGLRLLVDARFSREINKIHVPVLANMQVMALQLARFSTSTDESKQYQSWAAQTALWLNEQERLVLEMKERQSNNDGGLPLEKRLEMSMRLAEGLARKAVSTLPSAQDCWLFMETLTRQEKYQELLDWLLQMGQGQEGNDQDDGIIRLTEEQLQQHRAQTYENLHMYEEACKVYETLIQQNVDQWSYWMEFIKCCFHFGGMEETVSRAKSLLDSVLSEFSNNAKHVPRGPLLIKVELAAIQVRGGVSEKDVQSSVSSELLRQLQEAIVEYAKYWSPRASCAFSDLDPYVQLLVHTNTENDKEHAMELLKWSESLQRDHRHGETDTTVDIKKERSRLRTYIFAVKLLYRLVEMLNPKNEERLPSWRELVKEWQSSVTSIAAAKDTDDGIKEVVQKENQPGDELILIAVKRLLHTDDHNDNDNLYTAATLLECAMKHSPYNAYLAISAMDVYSELNATWRSWQLYQATLAIKHVQLDSCSFLILDKLVESGLYNEAVMECGSILKYHASTQKDTGDFMGRAMQHGTLTKTCEFMEFQKQKMNCSLTLLNAKHFIMDCAPLVHDNGVSSDRKKNISSSRPLAVQHGIIGGPNDLERATDMSREVHNPLGAPNIVSVVRSSVTSVSLEEESYSDNRDFSVLTNQTMQPIVPLRKEQSVANSLRCGHVHGLLIRASLCVDACKGPKKGKIQKPTDDLVKRCDSLLSAVKSASAFNQLYSETTTNVACHELLQTLLTLCQTAAVVCAGMPSVENDSLSDRELRVVDMLAVAVCHVQSTRTKLPAKELIPAVCRLLPDCLVPVFALLEMNGSLFATFGWGKRKCKTKAAAKALSDFALELRQLVSDLRNVFTGLPSDGAEENERSIQVATAVSKEVEGLDVDSAAVKAMADQAIHAQHVTRDRVVPVLDHVIETLGAFDVSDES